MMELRDMGSSPNEETKELVHTSIDLSDDDEKEEGKPQQKKPPIKEDRMYGLDVFKGLIMLIMAVDHCYDILKDEINPYRQEQWFQPAVWEGSVLEWITRQMTHLAAPGFFLLMGVGMVFVFNSRSQLNWTPLQIARYYAIRGCILLLFQFTYTQLTILGAMAVMHVGYKLHFNVFFPLGVAMILSGPLLLYAKYLQDKNIFTRLNPVFRRYEPYIPIMLWSIVAFLFVIISYVAVPYPPTKENAENVNAVLAILFVPNYNHGFLDVLYAALPWMPCTLCGLICGDRLVKDKKNAFKSFGYISIGFLVSFVIIRLFNFYDIFRFGSFRIPDPEHRNYYGFFSLCKYPPSLTFMLWTLGIDFGLLWFCNFALARDHDKWFIRPVKVFGSAPLFFYMIHFIIYGFLRAPFPSGTALYGVYIEWAVGLFVIYPLVKAYGNFKLSKPKDSIWRML